MPETIGLNRMAGRRALVTGAASGIGAAVAATLGREGAMIALVDRDKEQLFRVSSTLKAFPVICGSE